VQESIAIVHDYLNQCGGAERVALELARTWPGSPVYTSLYRRASTFGEFAEIDVRASVLDRAPVDRGFRALAPLYPLAFRSFGTLEEAVVISSSSGWAHGVRPRPHALHVVYCHTPARWLYRGEEHLGRAFGPALLAPLTSPLRRWDCAAAQRASMYVANCEHVRRRILSVYGRDAAVIHPPVDVARFTPRPRGERLLVVSRLLPYKRVDLIVQAATRAGLGLDVVGTGPCLGDLREIAGSTVTFHGKVDDHALRELFEQCRALCVAATEDFGIAPVEANAAGKPVVAYSEGGVLETQEDGHSAAFFDELTEEALLDAIGRADELDTPPADLAAVAGRFSAAVFRERMRALVTEAIATRTSCDHDAVAALTQTP
jgi:glycosyltransferase involved in cell wall biosynthesis